MPKHKLKLKNPDFKPSESTQKPTESSQKIIDEPKPDLPKKKGFCLVMIVKNESRIIERCLNSAKTILSYVSILDTGSTDNTIEIIKKWGLDNKIETTVHQELFKNFGYSRTKSVELAQKTYPQAPYFLLMDADFILEILPSFSIDALTKDMYDLMQYDSWIEYWNPRILKNNQIWQCLGVTHEYWDLVKGQKDRLISLRIKDLNDGGCKSDKYERDRKLLLEGINDDKTSVGLKTRYYFYLANTLTNLGEMDEAIKWYQKRIDAGGWIEEIFYSLMKIGDCFATKKEFASAEYFYREAWERHPTRSESIYKLSKMLREQSKCLSSYLYGIQAKKIPYPKDDVLFIDRKVYDYLIDFELSIACWYASNVGRPNYDQNVFNVGKEAQERLMKIMNRLPKEIAVQVEKNNNFYKVKA